MNTQIPSIPPASKNDHPATIPGLPVMSKPGIVTRFIQTHCHSDEQLVSQEQTLALGHGLFRAKHHPPPAPNLDTGSKDWGLLHLLTSREESGVSNLCIPSKP